MATKARSKRSGSWRLYDFENLKFVGPRETRVQAELRKSSITRRKRDPHSNWYRIRVNPIQVESDGATITANWIEIISKWRSIAGE